MSDISELTSSQGVEGLESHVLDSEGLALLQKLTQDPEAYLEQVLDFNQAEAIEKHSLELSSEAFLGPGSDFVAFLALLGEDPDTAQAIIENMQLEDHSILSLSMAGNAVESGLDSYVVSEQASEILATYTVASGDTLSAIALKVYGNASYWRHIYEANRELIGDNPNTIILGQILAIPPVEDLETIPATVVNGDYPTLVIPTTPDGEPDDLIEDDETSLAAEVVTEIPPSEETPAEEIIAQETHIEEFAATETPAAEEAIEEAPIPDETVDEVPETEIQPELSPEETTAEALITESPPANEPVAETTEGITEPEEAVDATIPQESVTETPAEEPPVVEQEEQSTEATPEEAAEETPAQRPEPEVDAPADEITDDVHDDDDDGPSDVYQNDDWPPHDETAEVTVDDIEQLQNAEMPLEEATEESSETEVPEADVGTPVQQETPLDSLEDTLVIEEIAQQVQPSETSPPSEDVEHSPVEGASVTPQTVEEDAPIPESLEEQPIVTEQELHLVLNEIFATKLGFENNEDYAMQLGIFMEGEGDSPSSEHVSDYVNKAYQLMNRDLIYHEAGLPPDLPMQELAAIIAGKEDTFPEYIRDIAVDRAKVWSELYAETENLTEWISSLEEARSRREAWTGEPEPHHPLPEGGLANLFQIQIWDGRLTPEEADQLCYQAGFIAPEWDPRVGQFPDAAILGNVNEISQEALIHRGYQSGESHDTEEPVIATNAVEQPPEGENDQTLTQHTTLEILELQARGEITPEEAARMWEEAYEREQREKTADGDDQQAWDEETPEQITQQLQDLSAKIETIKNENQEHLRKLDELLGNLSSVEPPPLFYFGDTNETGAQIILDSYIRFAAETISGEINPALGVIVDQVLEWGKEDFSSEKLTEMIMEQYTDPTIAVPEVNKIKTIIELIYTANEIKINDEKKAALEEQAENLIAKIDKDTQLRTEEYEDEIRSKLGITPEDQERTQRYLEILQRYENGELSTDQFNEMSGELFFSAPGDVTSPHEPLPASLAIAYEVGQPSQLENEQLAIFEQVMSEELTPEEAGQKLTEIWWPDAESPPAEIDQQLSILQQVQNGQITPEQAGEQMTRLFWPETQPLGIESTPLFDKDGNRVSSTRIGGSHAGQIVGYNHNGDPMTVTREGELISMYLYDKFHRFVPPPPPEEPQSETPADAGEHKSTQNTIQEILEMRSRNEITDEEAAQMWEEAYDREQRETYTEEGDRQPSQYSTQEILEMRLRGEITNEETARLWEEAYEREQRETFADGDDQIHEDNLTWRGQLKEFLDNTFQNYDRLQAQDMINALEHIQNGYEPSIYVAQKLISPGPQGPPLASGGVELAIEQIVADLKNVGGGLDDPEERYTTDLEDAIYHEASALVAMYLAYATKDYNWITAAVQALIQKGDPPIQEFSDVKESQSSHETLGYAQSIGVEEQQIPLWDQVRLGELRPEEADLAHISPHDLYVY